MVPDTLRDFFVASIGASAALIGLLFVTISIQTERIFGEEASGEPLAFAGSAFIALVNVFFASLIGLLPHLNFGLVALLGASGFVNSLLLLRDLRYRGSLHPTRGPILTVGSLIIYALEIWWGGQLLLHPDDLAALDNVTYVLGFAYGLGLARAWELLGGSDYGLIWLLLQRRRRGTGGPGRDMEQPGVRDSTTRSDSFDCPI